MNRLRITLLGAFQATFDGELLTTFGTNKTRALLAYLAMEAHRPHRREHLAGLLWSDQAEKKALHSLRQSLSILRKTLADQQAKTPYLLADHDTIQFNPNSDYWLDIAAFRTALERGMPQNYHGGGRQRPNIRRLQSALSLYQGNFLDQLILKSSPLFDEWAVLHREMLTCQVIESMCILSDYHERRDEFEQACKIAEQIVALIPWEENAHRVVMRMLAQTGQWSAAEVQYQMMQHYLSEDLGVEPAAETSTLMAEIRQSAGKNTPLAARFSNFPHNLPLETTPFIGRELELTTLSDLLASPESRLLTLTGPGGIGKSRLALQVAREQSGLFNDGVFFVPLTAVNSHQQIPLSIADAINFSFYTPDDPLKLLSDYLRQKDILLVLDDFEQLLGNTSPSSQMLSKLINEAPRVVIIVTSRQPLNLRMEQIVELQGLKYPAPDEIPPTDLASGKADYSGLQLFEQIARRVNPRYSLDAYWQETTRICQLVEGTPLAIELSASWIRGYGPTEIVRRIADNFDFLATAMQDIPQRHRSMRSVFNRSWHLLDENEKSILKKLTVFRGGFSSTAAETITGTTAAQLHALTDKSLLYPIEDARFDMHNLVRQFAREKLAQNASTNQEIHNAHCRYFTAYIQEQEAALHGPKPNTAQQIIRLEIENIRASWQWATDHQKVDALALSVHGLGRFFNIRSWFTEGREVFSKALNNLQDLPDPKNENVRVLSELATQLGWFEVQLGNYQTAISILEHPLENLRRLKAQRELAVALNIQGSAIFELGELEAAKNHFGESLAISQKKGFKPEAAFTNNYLGNIHRNQGDFDQARSFFIKSLQQYQQLSDQWGATRILNNLGNMAGIAGDYAAAKAYFEESSGSTP